MTDPEDAPKPPLLLFTSDLTEAAREHWLAMYDAIKPLTEKLKEDDAPFNPLAAQMLAAASLFLTAASELQAPIIPILQATADLIGVASPSATVH